MTDAKATAVPADALGLLEGAIGYALGAVQAVAPQLLPGPTPCAEWDLRTLLHHLNDALDTLREGIDTGRIGHPTDGGSAVGEGDPVADPAATFRDRAGRLLDAWRAGGCHGRVVAIAGHPLTASAVAATGAIEIAVHGWDIFQACGQARPIPAALATGLLAICPLVVTDATRHRLFRAPVAVSPLASPSDLLVAFFGRSPRA
jgi:uncharacterized protein (TIGR03086 family)